MNNNIYFHKWLTFVKTMTATEVLEFTPTARFKFPDPETWEEIENGGLPNLGRYELPGAKTVLVATKKNTNGEMSTQKKSGCCKKTSSKISFLDQKQRKGWKMSTRGFSRT